MLARCIGDYVIRVALDICMAQYFTYISSAAGHRWAGQYRRPLRTHTHTHAIATAETQRGNRCAIVPTPAASQRT